MKRISSQFGPPPWSWAIRWRYFRLVTAAVFWHSDTTAVRALMAVASVFSALGLWFTEETFQRPGFEAMAYVASENTWASLFMLHAAGVFWRVYDPVSRPRLGFAISAFGIGLWMFSTALIYYAIGKYSFATGMELAVVMAAFIALLRTGLNDEVSEP
jgi:hypothetical protein